MLLWQLNMSHVPLFTNYTHVHISTKASVFNDRIAILASRESNDCIAIPKVIASDSHCFCSCLVIILAASKLHCRLRPLLLDLRSAFNRQKIMDAPNFKKWNILYPVYINSKKTIAEGRRICAAKACENPTAVEIGDCCSHLKVPFAIELDKAYPRDFMQVGRVRFILKRPDGTLYNPAISSKKHLMLHIAELVPRHPGRVKKQEPTATSNTGPSKSGKGGKKKR
ncbi:hypothetical protein L2E82_47873 [Cichorium intybus]|uniref:Uncharacterized protein n=1 Tax=Cichorium intybus TaxID=13427 RepID=A0ACB8YX71_CICIN|nr:hypothetical protein L2E82_47873 [Cichorium intybus]